MSPQVRKHPKYKAQVLWNEAEALENSLTATVTLNSGLILLKECGAILRKDHNNMPGKVKLISGGGAGNEPAHTGFVGPGMLTAAVVGKLFSAPSSGSISKVIEELGTNHPPGILLIVQNYTGYRINFALAKAHAKDKGINARMIVVRDDVCLNSFEKTAGKRGLTGTLFIHKIAGAMADEGKQLDDIFNTCNRIIKNEEIVTVGVCIRRPLLSGTCICKQSDLQEIELGYGIHGETGVSRISLTSVQDIATTAMNAIINASTENNEDKEHVTKMFRASHDVAVIVNNLGGCSQLECNIFTMDVLKHLASSHINVRRAYVGSLMTTLDTTGFQVSLLNLSTDPDLIKYLDAETLAPAWPKILSLNNRGLNEDHVGRSIVPDKLPTIQPQGPIMNENTAQIFLTIITFACEALIACSGQLDIMDEDSGDGDCGTTISRGATAIKSAIEENQINGTRPFVTFRQISHIIDQEMGGLQGALYSLFFNAVAQVFLEFSEEDSLTAKIWLKALIAGNKVIADIGGSSEGDRTMLDPLIAAQSKLEETLQESYNPIHAFGEAVKSAEKCAIKTLHMQASCGQASLVKCKKFEYPDPGAHAVGIWMRAAYEGVKLKFSGQCDV